jgi:hypothetical protein
MIDCKLRIVVAASLSAALLACATPATEVRVPTMSMHQALDASQASVSQFRSLPEPVPALSSAPLPPGAQRPLLSTPDIRLAYLYEWVDGDGNRHFGEWVAIPVSGFHWIMNDGSRSAMPLTTPAAEETPHGEVAHR